MKKVLCAGIALAALIASPAYALGANSDKNLKKATAFYAGEVSGDGIVLLEVKRGMFQVSWKAQAPSGKIWICRSDDNLRNPQCRQLEEPAPASAAKVAQN